MRFGTPVLKNSKPTELRTQNCSFQALHQTSLAQHLWLSFYAATQALSLQKTSLSIAFWEKNLFASFLDFSNFQSRWKVAANGANSAKICHSDSFGPLDAFEVEHVEQ